jgi:hypothetical protein
MKKKKNYKGRLLAHWLLQYFQLLDKNSRDFRGTLTICYLLCVCSIIYLGTLSEKQGFKPFLLNTVWDTVLSREQDLQMLSSTAFLIAYPYDTLQIVKQIKF